MRSQPGLDKLDCGGFDRLTGGLGGVAGTGAYLTYGNAIDAVRFAHHILQSGVQMMRRIGNH